MLSIAIALFTVLFAHGQIAPAPDDYECTVSVFSENFESGIPAGWEVQTIDYSGPMQFYLAGLEGWFVHSDSTQSGGTGPSSAFEGNFYAYCEGSGPVDRLEQATLTTPDITLPTGASLSFYLNMFGPSTSLSVNIVEGMSTTKILPPVPGDIHGMDEWEQVYLDLSAFGEKTIRIQFEAVKPAANQNGDIAIDQVEICDTADPIPTLGQWALCTLFLLLLIVGVNSLELKKGSFI